MTKTEFILDQIKAEPNITIDDICTNYRFKYKEGLLPQTVRNIISQNKPFCDTCGRKGRLTTEEKQKIVDYVINNPSAEIKDIQTKFNVSYYVAQTSIKEAKLRATSDIKPKVNTQQIVDELINNLKIARKLLSYINPDDFDVCLKFLAETDNISNLAQSIKILTDSGG